MQTTRPVNHWSASLSSPTALPPCQRTQCSGFARGVLQLSGDGQVMEVVLQSSIVRSQSLVGHSQVAMSGGLGRPVIHLKAGKTDLKVKYERKTRDYEEERVMINCTHFVFFKVLTVLSVSI